MTVKRATLVGRAVLAACWVVGAAGCAAAPARSSEKPFSFYEEVARSQVLDTLRAYYAAFSARNWEEFATYFWPGATMVTVWQAEGADRREVMASSIPEIIAAAPQGPDSREIFEERMRTAEVRVDGDLAQVWAVYDARFGDEGDVSTWSGIDAFTLLRHEGRWKITSLTFTPEDRSGD